MLSDEDNLGIYDDLDEFQQAEDHKSKELLAWEVKHRNALTEIEDLKARNKALEKKIKTMEVNLQNLLDTAKSEVKRKEVLISQLRKEKDDICFRRKRGREVDEPAEKEPEKKCLKTASKMDPEVKKNPFKADSKNNRNPVGKRRSRSKSPRSRSKIPDHRLETRHKSRERRRSQSPRHSSRQEEHRSRGSSSRRRSRSPVSRAQISGSKSQKMSSLNGEDTTSGGRESKNRQHHEKVKQIRDIAGLLTPTELYKPEMATMKTQDLRMKCAVTSVDGYFQGNETNNPTNDISRSTGAFLPKEEFVPGLDMICEPAAHKQESPAGQSRSEAPEMNQTNNILTQGSVAGDPLLVQNRSDNPDKNAQADELVQVDVTATEFSKPAIESSTRNTNNERTGEEGTDNDAEKSELNHSLNKLTKNQSTVQAEVNAELLVASGTAQRDENITGSSAEPKSESCDAKICIVEDVRLPEVADIGHIAVVVDEMCGVEEEITQKPVSNEQENSSSKDVPSDLKEPSTPSLSSNVFYAQPDSTKVDHNDTENGVILEAALNLQSGSDLAPHPQSAPNRSYPNLSLEEDAVETALGQLHQTVTPDETVVTSTSNRARKAEDNCAPTSTSLSHFPLQAEEPIIEKTRRETDTSDDSRSQVSKIWELEPPLPGQDITIDETVDDGCIPNEEFSTVTKRCSLGHTDYQFEQRNDEIILRVKRRTRRRVSKPLDVQEPNQNNE
ncbi:uncharacterized protein FLASH [Drosophila kikkawai]|uniref:Uncharacterized protein FLASH n=1 Tax=Drosophila kikkawai TaxID=30033 RepID=A0A6P4JAM7_DROKI|nr:uncharacterized protein LOC108081806 [Drosophila kikkawai]